MTNSWGVHHLAVVVEDLNSAMSRYSAGFGLNWADPWTGRIPIASESGIHEPVISFTLSLEGPPHVELIQSSAHSAWRPGVGMHHFGVWTDDFQQDVEAKVREGFAVEVMSPTADFTYLISPDGARVELVNGRARQDFDRWLSGGEL